MKLRPEDHRGGLLTQASILSLTSDGTRHRPVHRGVWVSEAIFGRTPPPPPPNVEPLDADAEQQAEGDDPHAARSPRDARHLCVLPPEDRPARLRVRQLRRHRPLANREQVQGGKGDDPLVNAGGMLARRPGVRGAGRIQATAGRRTSTASPRHSSSNWRRTRLRRVMTIDDAEQIKAIAAASKKDGYKLRTVIENLVLSELFQKR